MVVLVKDRRYRCSPMAYSQSVLAAAHAADELEVELLFTAALLHSSMHAFQVPSVCICCVSGPFAFHIPRWLFLTCSVRART